jgi:membrane associated rhomboid family serine protease
MYFFFFYPIGLDIAAKRMPWLTALLVGSMTGVFLWQICWPDLLPVHPWDLVFFPGQPSFWTVATALFLHSGWLHLLGNLLYLSVFMPALEARLGSFMMLIVFVLTGIGGNLAHGVAAWQGWCGQGGLGILGASGAISGLIGFAIVRIFYARVTVVYWVLSPLQGQNRFGRHGLPFPLAVLAWLLLQVVGAALASESGSYVSYPAHLGGFGLGLLLALTMGGVREGRAEAILMQARRYLARGEGMAAAGAYSEYQECMPSDLTEPSVITEEARALLMAGLQDQSAVAYRRAHRLAVSLRRWDLALEVLAEGRRCQPGLGLSGDELASAAHRAEKTANWTLAIWIYQDLVQSYRDHPACNRAWVRLLLLLQDAPDRKIEAMQWLEKARRILPPGAWRDHLEWVVR